MITIRKADDRGHADYGWLNTHHTFSFGNYYDPAYMGFRGLRVINDDTVAPGRGFGTHPHDNMEIITVVLNGTLRHKDSMGEGGHTQDLTPGEVQHMSAGSGIMHSEFNPSADQPVHLYQIWIEPKADNVKPVYHQTRPEPAKNGLRLVASEGGIEGSIPINADARLYKGQLDSGKSLSVAIPAGRHAWVQLLSGGLTVNGSTLETGDGASLSNESSLSLKADSDAEFLIFDLA